MQANDSIWASNRYFGTPLVDATTSWRYLLWTYEYSSERSVDLNFTAPEKLLISKAIQPDHEEPVLHVLKAPLQTLIELRKHHALTELREIMRNA
jgi:hypothetical protein